MFEGIRSSFLYFYLAKEIMKTKLVSSDLNGTLVHQHTMSDMIRLYVGKEQFQQADAIFKRQTSGTASMEEAFQTAGPLTKGLTLRQAIEYTQKEMQYVNGFRGFVNDLHRHGISFVINSTGYSVTIAAIQAQIGKEKIHGSIGNKLVFGIGGSRKEELSEEELTELVEKYFSHSENQLAPVYDLTRAVGRVELGIIDENAKATLLTEYVKEHFPDLEPKQLLHLGDTMGDSGGIYGLASSGGRGVAFNYNSTLEHFLRQKIIKEPRLRRRVHFVDQKGPGSDLRKVLPIILGKKC